MKSLFVTLLIIGAAFLGYDYFMAPPAEKLVFKRPAENQPTPAVPEKSATPAPVAGAVTEKAAPVPPAASPSQPKPVEVVKPKAPQPKNEEDPAAAFHPPRFEPIEALTGNWQELPASAFPRAVKLVKDTTFTLSFGASAIRAGAEVVALSLENGQLTVSPNEASKARKAIAVNDTDLKSRLAAIYENWKRDRTEEARKNFEEMQRQPKPVAGNALVDEAGRPVQATDGTYPLLLQRLRTGQPSEVTLANIKQWGKPVQETVRGIPTWTLAVAFKTRTLFGEMDIDTLVHVKDGKVIDWVYKGSGEAVP